MKSQILFLIAIIGGLIVLWTGLIVWLLRKRLPHYRDLQYAIMARNLGVSMKRGEAYFKNIPLLKLLKGPMELAGNYQGMKLLLTEYLPARSQDTKRHTQVTLKKVDFEGVDFILYRRRFWSRLYFWRKRQQFLVGNPIFDDLFIIETNDPEAIKKLFNEMTCQQLIQFFVENKAHGALSMREGVLSYQERGRIMNDKIRERFEQVIIIMCCMLQKSVVY